MQHLAPDPESFLPLSATVFYILVALVPSDRHGYAIIQDVLARTDGKLRLSAGTLYGSVKRMLEDGLIQETEERPDPKMDDERRRYYRLTPLGRAVAEAEARRLDQLMSHVRAHGLLSAKESA